MYYDIILSLLERSEQSPQPIVVCLVVILIIIRRGTVRPCCAAC